MKTTHLTFALLLFVFLNNAKAQSPEEMMNTFFHTYQENKPVEALEELYSHTPWLERIKDDVDKLKIQFRDLNTIVGEYNGHEVLYSKLVKECFLYSSYIVKFDRQPIRFNFEFYKPKEVWILHSFSYDDSFDEDLENAIKFEILKLIK